MALNYHPQGLSEMVAQRRDVPLELVEKAVKQYRFNPVYLFTGIGPHFSGTIEDDGLRIRNLSIVTDVKGDERILHVPFQAQAGYGRLLDDPVFIQSLPSFQLPDPQFKSGTYRSFEVSGSSMEPTFRSGDLVIASFIEPRYWDPALKNNQVFIIVTQQDVFLKRVQNKMRSEQCIECCSDNAGFTPFIVPNEDICEVWRVRLRITSQIDQPGSNVPDTITHQLEVQNQLLESLQKQLNHVTHYES